MASLPPSQQKAREREARAAAERRDAILSGSKFHGASSHLDDGIVLKPVDGEKMLSSSEGAPALSRAVSQVFGAEMFRLLTNQKMQKENEETSSSEDEGEVDTVLSQSAPVGKFRTLQRSKSLGSLGPVTNAPLREEVVEERREEKDQIDMPEPNFVVFARQASRRAFQGFRQEQTKEAEVEKCMDELFQPVCGHNVLFSEGRRVVQVESWLQVLDGDVEEEIVGRKANSHGFRIQEVLPDHVPSAYWEQKRNLFDGEDEEEEAKRIEARKLELSLPWEDDEATPTKGQGLGCGWRLPTLEGKYRTPTKPFVVERTRPQTVSAAELRMRRERLRKAKALYSDAWAVKKHDRMDLDAPEQEDREKPPVHEDLGSMHIARAFKSYVKATQARMPHFLTDVDLAQETEEEAWKGSSLSEDRRRAREKRAAWRRQLEAAAKLHTAHGRKPRVGPRGVPHLSFSRSPSGMMKKLPSSRQNSARKGRRPGHAKQAVRGLMNVPSARPVWVHPGQLTMRSARGDMSFRERFELDFSKYV